MPKRKGHNSQTRRGTGKAPTKRNQPKNLDPARARSKERKAKSETASTGRSARKPGRGNGPAN